MHILHLHFSHCFSFVFLKQKRPRMQKCGHPMNKENYNDTCRVCEMSLNCSNIKPRKDLFIMRTVAEGMVLDIKKCIWIWYQEFTVLMNHNLQAMFVWEKLKHFANSLQAMFVWEKLKHFANSLNFYQKTLDPAEHVMCTKQHRQHRRRAELQGPSRRPPLK